MCREGPARLEREEGGGVMLHIEDPKREPSNLSDFGQGLVVGAFWTAFVWFLSEMLR